MLKTTATLAFLVVALPAAAQSVNGTVTKVDEAQGKLTINHGAIKNLDMPAMSMTFRLADPSWSDRVKVGDKVKFEADKVDGYFVLIKLDRLP